MWNWLVDKLIAFAKRTPYSHLHNADGSVYMERYWLIPYEWKLPFEFAVRVHHIVTPDVDRHLHDHPWTFLSFILRGWYIEHHPVMRRKCFDGDYEKTYTTFRDVRSWALRWSTDRHRISCVSAGGVWTLFISFNYMHWWGFYTPAGKIYYGDYDSGHTVTGNVYHNSSEGHK